MKPQSPSSNDLGASSTGLGASGFREFRVLGLRALRGFRVSGFRGLEVLGFRPLGGFIVSGFRGLEVLGFRVFRRSIIE